MENSELSFGPWLKRLRRSRDLTQEELADRIGCAPVTLRKIETEDRRPSKEIAQRLAEAFCVPESDRAAFMAFARASFPEDLPPPLVVIEPTVPIHQGRPSADRPLRSHNLPAQLTSFVGREREMPEIARPARRHPAADADRRRRIGQDAARPGGGRQAHGGLS